MNDLGLVEFDVSADKSSTESENEGFPLTQLPAESRHSPATASTSTTGNDCR